MKVIVNRLERMSLEQFCGKHGLFVRIDEYVDTEGTLRYAAWFGPFRVCPIGCTISLRASGESEQHAVQLLRSLISGQEVFIEHSRVQVPLLSETFTLELDGNA